MIERIFVVRGSYHNLAGTVGCGLGADAQFGQYACFADKKLVDVAHGGGRHTVDGCDIVALFNVHARFGERRAAIRRAGKYSVDTVEACLLVAAQFGTQQAHADTFGLWIFTGVDVSMSACQFGNHCADDIVQVEACLDIRQQHGIFLLDGFPVHSVYVFYVEAVAVGTPGFVEDLCPFLLIVYRSHHVIQTYLVVQCNLLCGQFAHIEGVAAHVENLFAAIHGCHDSIFGYQFVLLVFQTEGVRAIVAVVPHGLSVAVQVPVVAGR